MSETGYSRYRQYYQRLEPILKRPHVPAYTMAILSLLTLSVFGAFAIRPAIKEIFELNRKIEDRNLVSKKLDEKIKNLNLAQKEYEEVQDDLSLILTALPQDSKFPPFLKNLEGVASSSGVALDNLKFQEITLWDPNAPKSNEGAPKALNFSLDASGPYPGLFLFLQSLEKGKRLISLDDLSLTSDRKGTTSAGLKLNLKAQTYSLKSGVKEEEKNER